MQVHPTFFADVVWTEETYFSRNGMHNRQHIHCWALGNLKLSTNVQHQLCFGINIWCAIYNNKLIGPIFYDGILTGARYLQLLLNIMPIFLQNFLVIYLRNVWFEHDGAPAHKTSPVKQCLVMEFGNQVIGYGDF